MGAKAHTFFADLAQFIEAEDLEAARVGEYRPLPRHKAVQSAQFADLLRPRPQIEMVGVGEDDLRVQLLESLVRGSLFRRQCPDGHKDGRFHLTMRRLEFAGARVSITRVDMKRE